MSGNEQSEQFLCGHCGYGLFRARVWKRRFFPFLPRVCALICARCDEEHT